MNTKKLLLTFLVALKIGVVNLSADNLIPDPSFELATDGVYSIPFWRLIDTHYSEAKGTATITSEESYHGRQSLCLQNMSHTGIVVLNLKDFIESEPGMSCVFSAWVKVTSLNGANKSDDIGAYIIVQTFDTNGKYGPAIESKILKYDDSQNWIKISTKSIKVKEGFSFLKVACVVRGGKSKAYFDQLEIDLKH